MAEAKLKVGFIGTGVMGRSMAGHLLKHHNLYVYTRTRDKAEELVEAGASWCDDPKTVAERADVVFTIVGYPRDVEEIYFGERGLLSAARPGMIFVDCTTSSPLLAEKIAAAASAAGAAALDAPVSGGDVGAREARLSIMVGGDESVFAKVRPLLECVGANVVLQGPAGSGQHTKMVNQIAIASGMVGVCEALAYARRAGLNGEQVLKSISAGAAGSWSLTNLGPRMLKGDTAPGFYVKHFIKDMRIALESAEEMKLDLPGLTLAHELYDKLSGMGGADQGTQALYRLWTGTTRGEDAV